MGLTERLNLILDYKVEIDLNKRINRNKTLAVIGLTFLFINALGFYIGNRTFGEKRENYYDNKISNLQQVLADNPEAGNVQAEMAMTNYLKGDIQPAIRQLRDILHKDPENDTAQFLLGVMLSEQKQYDESISLLNKYVKNQQGLETRIAYLCLGQSYLGSGKYSLALKNLNIAAERDPGNPVIYYLLGQTYEKLNNRKGAISSYEKALELNNGYVEADRALISLLKRVKDG